MKKIINFFIILLCFTFISCSNTSITLELDYAGNTKSVLFHEESPDTLNGYIEFKNDSFEEGYIYIKCGDTIIEGSFSGEYNQTLNCYEYQMRINEVLVTAVGIPDNEVGEFAFALPHLTDIIFVFSE